MSYNKYLNIAEKVHLRIDGAKTFKKDKVQYLNKLFEEIVTEAAEENLKLRYNMLDFNECLNLPLMERKIKIDIGILPNFDDKEELILWMVSFIERLSLGKKISNR
ncbi:TPA: hypothetical protein MW252_003818 [Acinetobacter nosocomialis]|nr:hypothetical protein [Acinetobacter nosocomialis]